ncbi:MAG: sensor histidine kinase [Clostridiaceae bacterium]|nr:sensor histidine kinase [Clostridiaceae bacterium]
MKRLIRYISNLSVSWKFVFAYFSILILPIILTGFYLHYQVSESTIAQASLVMEQNLLQTKASILQNEKVIENISAILALNSDFMNFLEYEYENLDEKVEQYQFNYSPLIENILIQNNSIYSIRIYLDNIIISEMLSSYYSVTVTKASERFMEMIEDKPQQKGWVSSHTAKTHVFRNVVDNTQVFSYNRELFSQRQKYLGMLEIEVKEEVLFGMLRDPVINEMGDVFIVDSKNRIVSNNIPEYYLADVSETGLKDFQGRSQKRTIGEVNDIEAIIITIPIEQINCTIVGIFPVENFNSEIRKSLKDIIIVLAASSIVLGLIIYFTTNMLLHRVKKLVSAMKKVRDDNLNVSVPVKSMDEFGVLAMNFNRMTQRIYELVETVYKIQLMEREAELKALEAQINPHFLYNTLATISWVARKEKAPGVMKISNSLAKFYRLVLSKGVTIISIEEEVEMVKSYLEIQKTRFDDLFDVVYKIDERVYRYNIVKNILQPLVENALSHGIEPKRYHGTIIIYMGLTEDRICLKVIDDGVGMNSNTLSRVRLGMVERSKGSGYAVKNIMQRLRAYYGDNFSINIFSKPGIGTTVSIEVDKNI